MTFLSALALLIIFNLPLFHGASAEIIYEDGYSVTTVLDGYKLKINPRSLAPRPGSHDLLILDSEKSLFYTLSLPLSKESVVKWFAGNGSPGFSDGNAASATFDKPKSFAVDTKGNVYVADRMNFAIRKISESGVTTVAGGYSKTAGHIDGPGQNATFSPDFELTFVPDMCALLISDHGNRLIRLINLKQEDCQRSESGVGVDIVWPWVVATVASCLVGVLIGFAIRSCVIPRDVFNLLDIRKSWKSYLMNLGRQTQTHYFVARNAVASPALKFLSRVILLTHAYFSLLLSFRSKRVYSSSSTVDKDCVPLLGSDNSCRSEILGAQKYVGQMSDLISFDGDASASNVCNDILKEEGVAEKDGHGHKQIDDLMQANIRNFAEAACKSTLPEGPFLGVTTLVKRR